MRRKLLRAGRLVSAGAALGIALCANPTDQDPVRWRWSAQVPLSNHDFIVGEEMQEPVRNERFITSCVVERIRGCCDTVWRCDTVDTQVTRVLDVDSTYYHDSRVLEGDTIEGDVVVISIPDKNVDSFDIEQDTLEDKRFGVLIGPVALTGNRRLTRSVPYVAGAFNSGPLPVTLPGVYYLSFDSTSGPLSITLTNTSPMTLTNVIASIAGGNSSSPADIGPGASATVTVPVAKTSVGNTVSLALSFDASGPGTLDVDFSLDGLLADSLQVVDSLAQFRRTYINDYDLTDTLDVHYMDIGDGIFNYSMQNYSGLLLMVKGVHHELWNQPYCAEQGLEEIADLSRAPLDSTKFLGAIMDTYVPVAPHTDQRFGVKNIAGTRLFPQWDTAQSRCETYVEYRVETPAPTGQILTISENDSIIFWIRSDYVWGEAMSAMVAVTYERNSDTESVDVEYPIKSQTIDSLRGSLVFDSVPALISLVTRMPHDPQHNEAFVDTVFVKYTLWNPVDPANQTVGYDTLIGARDDSLYQFTVDITSLLNQFPSTLATAFKFTVPRGTETLLIGNETRQGQPLDALGRMTVEVDATHQVRLRLHYEIVRQTTVPLGDIDAVLNGYVALSKLEQPEAHFNVGARNNTNINMRLLCLMAPEELVPRFDWLDENYISSQLAESTGVTSGGYVNLLGPEGLLIPPRGESYDNSIPLTEAQLRAIFKPRPEGRQLTDYDLHSNGAIDTTVNTLSTWESRAVLHWQARLPLSGMDALSDTDIVHINASVHLEGIVSTDSLFSDWEGDSATTQ
jgi:hypothetical protein